MLYKLKRSAVNDNPRKHTDVRAVAHARMHARAVTHARAVKHASHTHAHIQTMRNTENCERVYYSRLLVVSNSQLIPVQTLYHVPFRRRQKRKRKKKSEKKRNEKILGRSWLFRHSAILRHRFTLRFIYKRQSLRFVTTSTSFSFTCTAIVEPVKKIFFFYGWIGNSMRIMMIWLVIRFE